MPLPQQESLPAAAPHLRHLHLLWLIVLGILLAVEARQRPVAPLTADTHRLRPPRDHRLICRPLALWWLRRVSRHVYGGFIRAAVQRRERRAIRAACRPHAHEAARMVRLGLAALAVRVRRCLAVLSAAGRRGHDWAPRWRLRRHQPRMALLIARDTRLEARRDHGDLDRARAGWIVDR